MPTYNYKCTSCEVETEKFSSIASRDALLEFPCENCGKMSVIRIPVVGIGFTMDKPPPLSGDFKNLLTNMKNKNTTLHNKSTINDNGF